MTILLLAAREGLLDLVCVMAQLYRHLRRQLDAEKVHSGKLHPACCSMFRILSGVSTFRSFLVFFLLIGCQICRMKIDAYGHVRKNQEYREIN